LRPLFLLGLILVLPIIVAMNPIDSCWQLGLYDEADTDQLVTQTSSPEGMIGLAVLVLVRLIARVRRVIDIKGEHDMQSSREPVPRGPPDGSPRVGLRSLIELSPRPNPQPSPTLGRPLVSAVSSVSGN
jgi:hypothetical protein